MTPFHDVPVWQSVSAEFVGSLVLGVVPGLIVENPTLVTILIAIVECS